MRVLVGAVIIAVVVIGLLALRAPPAPPPSPPPPPGPELTAASCAAAGGHWDECGSPCAGTDAQLCAQVCDAQCQCGGTADWSCPAGSTCRLTGKRADELGKCVPV